MGKKIILLFVFSRVLFLLFAALATNFISLNPGYIGKQFSPDAPYLAWVWANFDGRHFLNIATNGYQNFDFAFFPLYPFLISLFNFLNPLYVGILISSSSLIIGLYFVDKIVRLDYSQSISFWTVFFVCFFPLSFFYNSIYSDSLFFLLSVLSFYFARISNWPLAGLFAGLASMTRLSGIALIPALSVEWYLQNKENIFPNNPIIPFFKKGLPSVSLGFLGIGGYMFDLKIFKNDPFLFQKSFSAWKQDRIVFPFQVIYRYIKIFLSVSPRLLVYWVALLEFVSLAFYLTLGYFACKKIRMSYGVFMIALLLLVPFTGTFAGNPRYLLHLFPGFIAIALLVQNRPWLKNALIILFISLGFVLTALFTRGYFVS